MAKDHSSLLADIDSLEAMMLDKAEAIVGRVVAAARAYACSCGGTGRTVVTYREDGPIYADCQNCKEFRRIADGEVTYG